MSSENLTTLELELPDLNFWGNPNAHTQRVIKLSQPALMAWCYAATWSTVRYPATARFEMGKEQCRDIIISWVTGARSSAWPHCLWAVGCGLRLVPPGSGALASAHVTMRHACLGKARPLPPPSMMSWGCCWCSWAKLCIVYSASSAADSGWPQSFTGRPA
jgi:hypothetical protein